MIKKFFSILFLINVSFSLYSQSYNFAESQEENRSRLFEFLEKNDAAENQKDFYANFSTLKLNLNPHTATYLSEAQILNSLYEGLFTYNPITAEPDYAIATEFKTSRDKKFWTFTLRSDAKFSDGTQITSEDFKKSWIALLANKNASYSSFLDVIKGVKDFRLGKCSEEQVAIFAKDKNTLSIELNSPLSHLPQILCHSAFAVMDTKKENYSGPYKLTKHTEKELILTKNEFYYDAQNVLIPRIVITANSNQEEVVEQFNNGTIHWIDSDYDSKKLLDKKTIQLAKVFGTTYYFFKEGNSSYLTEKIRQALMDATPWDKLRYGRMFPAGTLILPIGGYTSPAPLDFTDFDHAKNLINEAKKELGLSEKEIIDLTVIIPEGDELFNQATILKNAWARVGVNLKIKVTAANLFMGNVKNTAADLFIYTWIGDFSDPIAFLELFKSDSSLNESNWKNLQYDELLNKAELSMNKFERYEYLSQAEDILLTSGMIIPINYSIGMATVNISEVGGWTENPLNIHPFKSLYFRNPKSTFKYGIVANAKIK